MAKAEKMQDDPKKAMIKAKLRRMVHYAGIDQVLFRHLLVLPGVTSGLAKEVYLRAGMEMSESALQRRLNRLQREVRILGKLTMKRRMSNKKGGQGVWYLPLERREEFMTFMKLKRTAPSFDVKDQWTVAAGSAIAEMLHIIWSDADGDAVRVGTLDMIRWDDWPNKEGRLPQDIPSVVLTCGDALFVLDLSRSTDRIDSHRIRQYRAHFKDQNIAAVYVVGWDAKPALDTDALHEIATVRIGFGGSFTKMPVMLCQPEDAALDILARISERKTFTETQKMFTEMAPAKNIPSLRAALAPTAESDPEPITEPQSVASTPDEAHVSTQRSWLMDSLMNTVKGARQDVAEAWKQRQGAAQRE